MNTEMTSGTGIRKLIKINEVGQRESGRLCMYVCPRCGSYSSGSPGVTCSEGFCAHPERMDLRESPIIDAEALQKERFSLRRLK
jgi:hypothetical protein